MVLFPDCELHAAGGQYGFGHGFAARRGAAALRHGTRATRFPNRSSARSNQSTAFRATTLCWWERLPLSALPSLSFFPDRLGGGAYEIGAQALNFGAFIAFMGVNAAAFIHYWRQCKEQEAGRSSRAGAGLCDLRLYLVHLSRPALLRARCGWLLGFSMGRSALAAFARNLSPSRSLKKEASPSTSQKHLIGG